MKLRGEYRTEILISIQLEFAWCKVWSLIEGRTLIVLENIVLRKTCGPKKDKMWI
jgi:hypothetical protein